MLQLKSAGSLLTRVHVFTGDHQSFVLFRPLTDWKMPTSITEGDLLYSRSDDLNVHPIHRHPHIELATTVRSQFAQGYLIDPGVAIKASLYRNVKCLKLIHGH